MATATVEALRARYQGLEARYTFRFAGHPRATRDLDEIHLLLKEVAILEDDARRIRGPGAAELIAEARQATERWRAERDAIEEARAAGERFVRAALLGTRANFLIARYHRHFAGHDRRTRDLELLRGLNSDLETIQRQMARILAQGELTTLRDDIEVVTENLALYRQEADAIEEARAAGTTDERASLMAYLANRQFERYKNHFAGRSRLTRRAAVMEQILESLASIHQEMLALAGAGLSDEANQKNIDIVTERRARYGEELQRIETERARATATRVVEALESECGQVMAEYDEEFSGHDRATRDPGLLAVLADRLTDVESELTELQDRYDLDPLQGRAGLVRDSVALLCREWGAVREARLH